VRSKHSWYLAKWGTQALKLGMQALEQTFLFSLFNLDSYFDWDEPDLDPVKLQNSGHPK
jgi:hypothetical protein